MTQTQTSIASLAFVDASLPDLATLLAGLPAGLDVQLLDPAADGLAQMAQHLAHRADVPALHVVTHGQPGALHLGTLLLNRQGLTAHAAELDTLCRAMAEDGEILIYGCEVAAGREGQQFVNALADMTGLKVAAATHKVGATALGGSWQLNVGVPVAQTLRVAGWEHVLEPTAFTFDTDTTNGGNSDYTETKAGVTLSVASAYWAVSSEQGGFILADMAGNGSSSYVFSQAIDISSIDWVVGTANAEVTFVDLTPDSTKTQTFTLTGADRQTLTLTGWEGVTAFRITGGSNGGIGDKIDNIVFTVPEVHKPVIGGITAGDNQSFAAGTYVSLDGAADFAFISDANSPNLVGGYLSVAYTSGTEDGTFRFDPDAVSAQGAATGTVGVLAGNNDGSTLKTNGSFAAWDSVFVIDATGGKTKVGVVDGLYNGQSGSVLKIRFTATDATTGADSNSGNAGFVLQYLQYTAPTGGARTFAITANDGTSTSDPVALTLTARAAPVIDLNGITTAGFNTEVDEKIRFGTEFVENITDGDSSHLKSITVSFAPGEDGDWLSVKNPDPDGIDYYISLYTGKDPGQNTTGFLFVNEQKFSFATVRDSEIWRVTYTSVNESDTPTPAEFFVFEDLLDNMYASNWDSVLSSVRTFSITATDAEDNVTTTPAQIVVNPLPKITRDSSSERSLNEASANDGTIANNVVYNLTGDAFLLGSDGKVDGVTFIGVPGGLTASLAYNSPTQATLTLTGTATAHTDDDGTEIQVIFSASSFAGGATVSNYFNDEEQVLREVDFTDGPPEFVSGVVVGDRVRLTYSLDLNADTLDEYNFNNFIVKAGDTTTGYTAINVINAYVSHPGRS